MRKLKWLLPVLLVLFTSTTFASNMGFKLNKTMTFTGGTANLFFVSLPWFNSYLVAQDICNDFPNLANIKRYNSSSDTITTHFCGSVLLNFAITEGTSYGVTISADSAPVIVGSHDDAASLSFTFTGGLANLYFVSVPYHTTSTLAQTLCSENANFANIKRYNSATDTITTHFCGSVLLNFAIDAGTGYGVTINTTTSWTPAHF